MLIFSTEIVRTVLICYTEIVLTSQFVDISYCNRSHYFEIVIFCTEIVRPDLIFRTETVLTISKF
jgi:hypothetical protein